MDDHIAHRKSSGRTDARFAGREESSAKITPVRDRKLEIFD